MGYAVYLQKFSRGEQAAAPYGEVIAILERYGSVSAANGRLQFHPDDEDICEFGSVHGTQAEGINGVSITRPLRGGRLPALIFEVLGLPGMCYFEQDVEAVLARTDVGPDLPSELLDMCKDRKVTVIASADDIRL